VSGASFGAACVNEPQRTFAKACDALSHYMGGDGRYAYYCIYLVEEKPDMYAGINEFL
jgi:hypothetical protein